MAGKSPITATDEQRAELMALAGSRDRGEADRTRAVLLTLSGWTSPTFAEAFGVREDTVRLWRSDFAKSGAEALEPSVAPGPPPVKSQHFSFCLNTVTKEQISLPLAGCVGQGPRGGGLVKASVASRWSHEWNSR